MANLLYASLTEVKGSVRIDVADTQDDVELTRALTGASRAVDRVTGRRFWIDDTASARKLNPANRVLTTTYGESLFLTPDIAELAGLIVEYGDGTTFSTFAGYDTYPEDALIEGWPVTGLVSPFVWWPTWPGTRVRVTAKWGWPSVPADINSATLILARRLFARKDSVAGIMGSQEWVVNLAKKDPDVQSLIEHFMIPGFG